jgi:hypothetical protein
MSKKTKEKKKAKKKPPQEIERNYDVTLPSGQTVSVRTRQSKQDIDVKAKVQNGMMEYGMDFIPIMRNLYRGKGKNKEIVKDTVKVNGVEVRVRFKDGETLEARSCCKPPDIFKVAPGKRLALGRIFIQDLGLNPAKINLDKNNKPILKSDKLQRLEKEYEEAASSLPTAEDIDKASNNVRELAEKVKKERLKPINGRKPRLSEEDQRFLVAAVIRNGKPVIRTLGYEKAIEVLGGDHAENVLGVSDKPTLEEIRAAFREAKKDPQAKDFKRKQAAFEVLREKFKE